MREDMNNALPGDHRLLRETTTETSAMLWGVPTELLRRCMRDIIAPQAEAATRMEALGITILRDDLAHA